uniref:Uncharacterized protein n=1 Tax=Anguilla anguilla TaxID=7936 RepID=A0A0E9PNJ2_ANGAN
MNTSSISKAQQGLLSLPAWLMSDVSTNYVRFCVH